MMHDFKIIGSGPTGSYTAARLAKLGYKVTLIDKAHFPRDKLCGGGLTLKSLTLLRNLYPDFDNSGLVDFVTNFEIMNPQTRDRINKFNYQSNWLGLVKRQEFDDWLRQKAIESGVEYIECNKGLTYINDNIESRFTIAADGVNSELGKIIHGSFSSDEVVIATEAYIPNPDSNKYASVILNPTHDPLNGGYSWVFARHDRVGVGTGVVRNYDKHMNYYRGLITDIAYGEYKLVVKPSDYRNWVIPIFKDRRMAVNGKYVCIGDALGVADPIYAEGIAAGMISAERLIKAFQQDKDFSNFENYLYYYPYFAQMKWMNFLQRQANSNFNLAFKLLQQPGVVDGFLKFINWEQTPKKFVNWIWMHYPKFALQLALQVRKNKGIEKEVLNYGR